jgi:hypothetical protein
MNTARTQAQEAWRVIGIILAVLFAAAGLAVIALIVLLYIAAATGSLTMGNK